MEIQLASIYLEPSHPASFGGLDAVYRAVKEEGKTKISRKLVQDWLSQQDVYTLHKPAPRHYKRSRVIVPGINAQFQADLCDVQNLSRYNKGYKYLFTCVEIFNKYAWVVAFKTKQSQELGANHLNYKQIRVLNSLIACFRNSFETITLISSQSIRDLKHRW